MSETPTTSPPDPASATKDRGWVWRCSEDSIKRGQISALAVAEIPIAMAFFWWLSSISPWPWMTLVGLMAAPLLLLRSPASIVDGVSRLRAYKDRETLSKVEKVAVFIVAAVGTFCVSYWLAQHWLVDGTGFLLIMCSALSAVAVMVVCACARAFAHAFAHARVVAFIVAFVIFFVAVFAVGFAVDGTVVSGMNKFAFGYLVAGVGALAFAFVVAFTVAGARLRSSPIFVALFPAFFFGLFLRVLCIRIAATFIHLHGGLQELAHNWRETVLSIDARHLPELLPQAGSVDSLFTISGIIGVTKKVLNSNMSFFDSFHMSTIIQPMILIIYFPALIYRWNLKASALLWGPIAYALRPVVWLGGDEDMRSKIARRTTKDVRHFCYVVLSLAVGWLLLPHLPETLIDSFPAWSTILYGYFTAPSLSIRSFMVLLFAASICGLLASSHVIRPPHEKLFESATEFENAKEKVKEEIRKQAVWVQRWLNITLAITVITIWVFALWWAMQRWPNELHNVVWDWIKPWL